MIGLWSFIVIMLYVNHEKSFDDFNLNKKRIFRLTSGTDERGPTSIVPYKWGEVLKDDWAEVEYLATIQNITIGLTVKRDDMFYTQHGVVGADPEFLNIFDFPIIYGEKDNLLKAPDKVLLTPETAIKYFGDDNPIGEMLTINLWGNEVQFEVEGIVANPQNSHLQFQMLIPVEAVRNNFFNPKAFGSWKSHFAYTYLMLRHDIDFELRRKEIQTFLDDFLEQHGGPDVKERYNPDLQPLSDIYLKSTLRSDFQPRGSYSNVQILELIAIGILVMALINFVNISSAQSASRIREFGLKKILGSSKTSLIVQFVGESIVIASASLLIALVLAILALPSFNEFTHKALTIADIFTVSSMVLMILVVLVVGLLSGIYPTFVMASNKATSLIGSQQSPKSKTRNSRRFLIVTQFTIAILLLVSTGVVYEQVVHMNKMDLGFNKNQVILMKDARSVARDPAKVQLLRSELLKHGYAKSVCASSSHPGETTWASRYVPEGYEASQSISISTIYTDHDFIRTYEIALLNGRDFDRTFSTDSGAYLINSAAVNLFATKDPSWISDPISKKIVDRFGVEGTVIGVFDDFMAVSVREKVEPLILHIKPSNFFALQMKVGSTNIAETLEGIELIWKQLFPSEPFTYSFVDREFGLLFEADQRLGKVLQLFAFLSIGIAMLGLFGQASMLAHEKSKEVGIRKVIGASENQLISKLTWQFLKLIILANVVAIPTGYYITSRWLERYAYRVEIPYYVFPTAAILTMIITLFTISYHTLKTAGANPVQVLAQE